MLMLKLQYLVTNVKCQLIGKKPDDGKIEGKRRKGWQMRISLNSITNSKDMNLSKLWGLVKEQLGVL